MCEPVTITAITTAAVAAAQAAATAAAAAASAIASTAAAVGSAVATGVTAIGSGVASGVGSGVSAFIGAELSTQLAVVGAVGAVAAGTVQGVQAEQDKKTQKKDIKAVRRMVESHMRAHALVRGDVGPKALRKFVRNVGEELVEAVLDLAEADSLGNLPQRNEIPKLRQMIDEATKDAPISAKPPLNGNEIQRLLGIKQGREVGEAMKFLQDQMDEYAAKGRELTRPIAEKLLQERFLNG